MVQIGLLDGKVDVFKFIEENEVIFNVITKYDTDEGYDVSVASFKEFDEVKNI